MTLKTAGLPSRVDFCPNLSLRNSDLSGFFQALNNQSLKIGGQGKLCGTEEPREHYHSF
jgi:hypothetical protein